MKRVLFLTSLLVLALAVVAQPRYRKEQMMLEKLNRGVVAMRHGDKVVCTGKSLHCFSENGHIVAISKRLPGLYAAICAQNDSPNQ